MAMAADLGEAAHLAAANLATLWMADTLQAKMTAFWKAIQPEFPEQSPNNQPVGAWISIIAAFSPTILDYGPTNDAVPDTIATYEQSVDYIYRLCKFAAFYSGQDPVGTAFITIAQADAILAAYNAQFA